MEPTLNIGRFRLFAWSEWHQLIRPHEWNWINFYLLWWQVEYASYKESLEMNIGLLGFCVSVDWYYGSYGSDDKKEVEG